MPPREPDQIPLQEVPNIDGRPTVTPAGTMGGFTPHPDHPDHALAMRTFSSDLAQALKDQNGSAVKIAIAEDEKRRQGVVDASPTSKKNMTFIIIGSAAIVIAGVAIGITLWYKNKNAPVAPAQVPDVPAIVKTEEAGALDLTGMQRNEIVPAIRAIVAAPNIRVGTMKNIVLTKTSGATVSRIGSAEFLSSIDSHAPADFTRALEKNFELGVYVYDHTNLFLVLRGTAHDYVLTGMLDWEPYMLSDLAGLFGIATDGANASLFSNTFQSVIIQNRDSRALVDMSKNPVLFYSFLDPDTVIITTDPKTLTEAIRRLEQ